MQHTAVLSRRFIEAIWALSNGGGGGGGGGDDGGGGGRSSTRRRRSSTSIHTTICHQQSLPSDLKPSLLAFGFSY